MMATRLSFTVLLLSMSTVLAEDRRSGIEDDIAILFPWFSEALGICVFFLLTRYCPILPFTGCMFILGACMGVGVTRLTKSDDLTLSIIQWSGINSELLLRSFLPGLLYGDAFGISPHLFEKAFWQLIILAFPMVLAGTCLTALVCFYIFPYDWSWNLSMTVGSILAATDPVAVCSLLEALGAPPRLQLHISGESMLNDGSAYVFFVIFSSIYLTELGIAGVGEDYDLGGGFAAFFQLALGGGAIGVAFGLGQCYILFKLNKRLNAEENVLQVVSTITLSYLAYYVSDISGCSGVLAVVFLGITTKAFGNSYINDHELFESFWTLVGQLLNTLLFALAGVIWGSIIGNALVIEKFTGKDWGYMIMFYVLLNCIRVVILAGAYPVVSRIGLKSCIPEVLFSAFGGLRGAVAIALAVSLNASVSEAGEESGQNVDEFQVQTQKAFAMIGGMAFLTLLVNGTLSGPVLKSLGLVKATDTRVELLKDFTRIAKEHVTDDFVRLMADPRFRQVDFSVVKAHVKILEDLTFEELKAAVLRNKDVTPNLENVLPYMETDENSDLSWVPQLSDENREPELWGSSRQDLLDDIEHASEHLNSVAGKKDVKELRLFFLEVLRAVYNRRIEQGELDGREGFVAYSLLVSLDFSEDRVNNGESITDWELMVELRDCKTTEFLLHSMQTCWTAVLKIFARVHGAPYHPEHKARVNGALAYIDAHQTAEGYFIKQLTRSSGDFPEKELVVEESQAQVLLAKESLEEYSKEDLEIHVSHYFCNVLLNRKAKYVEKLGEEGILQEGEVATYLDTVEEDAMHNAQCGQLEHPGMVAKDAREQVYHQSVDKDEGIVEVTPEQVDPQSVDKDEGLEEEEA